MFKFFKTIATALCGILIFGAAAGAGTALYMGGKNNGWFDEYIKTDTEQTTPYNDVDNDTSDSNGLVVTPTSTKLMKLTVTPMVANADNDSYAIPEGISTYADTNSYTLTATVTPAAADNKAVDWSIAWKNPASSWASGKDISSYLTVSTASDDSLTATVTCKQAFGEQAIVTVTSRQNTDIKASVTVDYKEKFVSAPYSIQIGGSNYTVNNSTALPLSSTNGTGSVNVSKSVGTISTNFTATATIKLADSYIKYLQNNGLESCILGYDSWHNATGSLTLANFLEDVLYGLMSDEIIANYLEDEVYAEVYDYTRNYTGTVFEVNVTVKEGSTTVSTVTYTAPLDRSTVAVPVGSLTLTPGSIVF